MNKQKYLEYQFDNVLSLFNDFVIFKLGSYQSNDFSFSQYNLHLGNIFMCFSLYYLNEKNNTRSDEIEFHLEELNQYILNGSYYDNKFPNNRRSALINHLKKVESEKIEKILSNYSVASFLKKASYRPLGLNEKSPEGLSIIELNEKRLEYFEISVEHLIKSTTLRPQELEVLESISYSMNYIFLFHFVFHSLPEINEECLQYIESLKLTHRAKLTQDNFQKHFMTKATSPSSKKVEFYFKKMIKNQKEYLLQVKYFNES